MAIGFNRRGGKWEHITEVISIDSSEIGTSSAQPGYVLTIGEDGKVSWQPPSCSSGSGSGSTPGGSTGEIQYNKNGVFGGTKDLYWDDTNNFLGFGTTSPQAKLHIKVPDINVVPLQIESATGLLPGWNYRRPITIDNTQNSSVLTDYQVKITLDSTNFDFSKAKSDGSDIRFTDKDGSTLLSYWIESWDATNQQATIWVKVPSIPASSTKTIYIYYGNPSATSESNVDAVFYLYDDFDGSELDTNKWEVSSGITYSVSDSKLHVTGCPENEWNVLFGFKAKTYTPVQDNFILEADGVTWDDGGSNSPLFKWRATLSDGTDQGKPLCVGIDDAWAGSTGEKVAIIESNTYASGENSLSHSGTVDLKIIKTNGYASAFWGSDEVLTNVQSTSTIKELWLVVNRYSTNPFAKELTIDKIVIRGYANPEPTTSVGGEEIPDASTMITSLLLENRSGTLKTLSITPSADNAYDLGSSTLRWRNLYAITTTVGDVVFKNNWRITEHDDHGNLLDGLRILNKNNEEILKITEDGVFFKGNKIG